MAIGCITIDNFSVFKDVKIDFCSGINVIIGNNGTGKTHILKLLYALLVASSEGSYDKILQDQSKDNDGAYKNGIPPTSDIIKGCFRPYSLAMLLHPSIKYNGDTWNNRGTVAIYSDTFMYEFNIDPIREGSFAEHSGSSYSGINIHNGVFIPANEMLTHATLYNMKVKYGNDIPYDDTCLNIIELARRWKLKETPPIAKDIIEKFESIMGGTVVVKDDGSFWMQKDNGLLIPFTNETEGIKRFGLLWQLLLNESINPKSILFWDEPENSINPTNIPILVEALLEMQRHGVQIFVTTHNYYLARYFEVLKRPENTVLYHNLYQTNDGMTSCSQVESYIDIESNSIGDAGKQLYQIIAQKAINEV